jgi:hypothetical protein
VLWAGRFDVREETLKRFLQGDVTAADLAKDVAGSTERLSPTVSRTAIEDMGAEFTVTRPMLVSLTDAVLAGSLPPDALATIGFALEASDKFVWDGDSDQLFASVIADWSCPEVNYPLTLENVARFRAWLTGGEPYPERPTIAIKDGGRLVSVRDKRPTKRP